MKHLEAFKFFKKKEYKGKKETYRFANIHQDKKGHLVGDCKKCKLKNVDIADHGNDCEEKS